MQDYRTDCSTDGRGEGSGRDGSIDDRKSATECPTTTNKALDILGLLVAAFYATKQATRIPQIVGNHGS